MKALNMLLLYLVKLKIDELKYKGVTFMKEKNASPSSSPQIKGKVYRPKAEALREYNISLPEQPLPQPKEYEEIEY